MDSKHKWSFKITDWSRFYGIYYSISRKTNYRISPTNYVLCPCHPQIITKNAINACYLEVYEISEEEIKNHKHGNQNLRH